MPRPPVLLAALRAATTTPVHCVLAGAIVLGAAGAASAHHGFGNFDRSREVLLKGTVTSIDFVNPHAYVYFDVAGARRHEHRRSVARCAPRPCCAVRAGPPRCSSPASRSKSTGAPDRFDSNSCYVHTVVFADGTTADRYAQLSKPAATAAPAPPPRAARLASGEPNISGDWAPEQMVMTDPRGRSGALVPVSEVEEFEPGDADAAGGGDAGRTARVATTYTEAGEDGRRRVPRRTTRQSAHALRDDQHPVRLDVRRPRQSHHAERRHDHAAVRPARLHAHDSHERAAPGDHRAEPRRALDGQLGERRARRRHRRLRAGRVERRRS